MTWGIDWLVKMNSRKGAGLLGGLAHGPARFWFTCDFRGTSLGDNVSLFPLCTLGRGQRDSPPVRSGCSHAEALWTPRGSEDSREWLVEHLYANGVDALEAVLLSTTFDDALGNEVPAGLPTGTLGGMITQLYRRTPDLPPCAPTNIA